MKIVNITEKVRMVWVNQYWNLYLEGTEELMDDDYFKSMIWDWYPIEGNSPADLYVYNNDGIILKMVHLSNSSGFIDRTITLRNGDVRDILGAWSSNSSTLLRVTGIQCHDTSYNLMAIDISEGALKGLMDKFGFSAAMNNDGYEFNVDADNCTPHAEYKNQFVLTPVNK